MSGAALKKSATVTLSTSESGKPALRVERVEMPARVLESIRTNLRIARNAATKQDNENKK